MVGVGVNIGANVILNTGSLYIGNSTANIIGNSIFLQITNSTATANLSPVALTIGTSVTNATVLAAGANVILSTTSLTVGNTVANLVANSISVKISNSTANVIYGANGITFNDATVLNTATPTIDLIFIIGDGTNVITTGVASNWVMLDFAGTFVSWTLLADVSGSVSIDLWKCTYTQFDAGATHPVVGDKISASAPLTFSTTTKGQSSTLTGWTNTFSASDVLALNVATVTTCKQVKVIIKVTKTS